MRLRDLSVRVAKEFGIAPKQIRGSRGPQRIIMARWAFIWLATWFEYADSRKLSQCIGLRVHSINHALRKINNDLETNPKYRSKVYKIGRELDPQFNP